MASYTKMTVGKENRTELHEKLALTGAEISLNTLPAGANVPFVHSHKANEEIYGVLSGKGKVVIDGEEISLAVGDWLKISPMAKRQFFAASNSEITYICIQVKENSLEGYTATDAVIYRYNISKQKAGYHYHSDTLPLLIFILVLSQQKSPNRMVWRHLSW